MLRTYYDLTKPGIIYGNVFAAVAGFVFGSPAVFSWEHFFAMLTGLWLVIAGACVFNNYHDRHIDARMERTKNRALASGAVSHIAVLVFASVLEVLGIGILFFFTNLLAFTAALVGVGSYLLLYTPLKSRTPFAMYAGAIAGATPPVVGYTAATGVFDWYALALFIAMYIWQIPHFLSIAIFRYEEYKAAGVPLFIRSAPSDSTKKKARQAFLFSLVVLVVCCGALILQRWIR